MKITYFYVTSDYLSMTYSKDVGLIFNDNVTISQYVTSTKWEYPKSISLSSKNLNDLNNSMTYSWLVYYYIISHNNQQIFLCFRGLRVRSLSSGEFLFLLFLVTGGRHSCIFFGLPLLFFCPSGWDRTSSVSRRVLVLYIIPTECLQSFPLILL